jgi:hypothetical protein
MSEMHAQLAAGRWSQLSILQQVGNIGSEVGRAVRAKEQGNQLRLTGATTRALELFDLTIETLRDPRLREVLRAREVVCDYLLGDNDYHSTGHDLERYFNVFAIACRSSGLAQ